MNQFTQVVVDTVRNAGGSMLYPDLFAATAPEMRQGLPSALKEAKAEKLLRQEVAFADGKLTHTIMLVEGAS